MVKFIIEAVETVPLDICKTYHVDAKTREEAEESWKNGDAKLVNTVKLEGDPRDNEEVFDIFPEDPNYEEEE